MGFQPEAGGSSLEPVWGWGRGARLKSALYWVMASWLLLEASFPSASIPQTFSPPSLLPSQELASEG